MLVRIQTLTLTIPLHARFYDSFTLLLNDGLYHGIYLQGLSMFKPVM